MRPTLLALLVTACAPDDLAVWDEGQPDPDAGGDALLPADQAPPPLVLDTSAAAMGGTIRFDVYGGLAGENLRVFRSLAGPGQGPCDAAWGGECLDIAGPRQQHATIRLNSAGIGDRSTSVPNAPALAGDSVCFQAVAVRGAGGASTEMSNVVCRELGYDADGDNVLDPYDACPAGNDFHDFDEDGTPDACDAAGDRAPVCPNVTPSIPWTVTTFQGRQIKFATPPNPIGHAIILHGSGGDATVADATETVVLLNELLDRGIGFSAITSDNRQNKQFDLSRTPNTNPDWARVNAWRTQLINQGRITANTTMYAWGFSNGGGFAGWLSNAAPSRGWPLGAIAVQASSTYNPAYGAAGDVPTMFIGAINDTIVPAADIENRYQNHIGNGYPGQYRLIREERLAPTRFDRSDQISSAQADILYRIVIDQGYFTLGGRRTFGAAVIETTIDTIGNEPGFYPSKPGKGVLTAVLAGHAINATYATAIADYFYAWR